VTLAEAALGGKVDIPTPRGTVSLQIPPGTSSGTKLRVRGHGIAAKNAPPGDLLAEVQIALPKPMDEATRDLLRQTADHYPRSPRADLRW
jgi:DnaJ-class molecular chaperone